MRAWRHVAVVVLLALGGTSAVHAAPRKKKKPKPEAASAPLEVVETAPPEPIPAVPEPAPAPAPAKVIVAPAIVVTVSPSELLARDLALLEKKKLAPAPATRVDELDEVLEQAHQRELLGRKDEAAMMLLEAVEGPRFRAFEALDSFAAAELMLASLLIDQGAWSSAQRSVERLLARGKDSATFGPAFRRAVDIALARRNYDTQQLEAQDLPRDAQDELHYLHGLAGATNELASVSKTSRFYARAQYLLGTSAAANQRWDDADRYFAEARTLGPRTLYASTKWDETEDLAQLGRARVAHERGESKRAGDFYFRVPSDSPWLPEALFEAAYANYERGRTELALDTLAQLEARYPSSPYTAEARVLRGYVQLASFDFEQAERELTEFEQTFGAVLSEIDATLESPSSLRSLFAEQAAGLPAEASKHDALLRGLLVRDPALEHVQLQLRALDAELARGSQLDAELLALAARVRGQDLPRARNDAESPESLHERARALSEAVIAFGDELRALKRAGAKREDVAELEQTQRKLGKQGDRIAAELRAREHKAILDAPPPSGAELGQQLDEERAYAEAARARALALRDRLEQALLAAERSALTSLRARLEGELRRARLGRIDAVMGKKRKLELELESLAAGRFPPELVSRKRTPVYLRDDEEYWPFEGEDWPDEREERGPR